MTCDYTQTTNMEWRALGNSAAEGCEANLVLAHCKLKSKQDMCYLSEKPALRSRR